MRSGELFDVTALRQPLTPADKKRLINDLIQKARLNVKFMYSIAEVSGLLHCSKDSLNSKVDRYIIDAVRIMSRVVIPWWSLAEYLLDPCRDLDKVFYEYTRK